ncbi:hypothetical protein EJB05_30788, partial [Eragrostis curvula]
MDPRHVRVFWSQHGLTAIQEIEAIELGLGGLRTCQIIDVMENYGDRWDTWFLLRDMYNFFARKKKKNIEGCDAEYMKKVTLKTYFGGTMDSIAFGDFIVLVFNNTYRVNKYNLPFIPSVGVDHHRKTMFFGCGLLFHQSVSSYIRLLEAFPKTKNMQWRDPFILFSLTRTISCAAGTYIERNIVSKLRDTKLKDLRKFVYHEMYVEEFERRWLEFMETHNVTETYI